MSTVRYEVWREAINLGAAMYGASKLLYTFDDKDVAEEYAHLTERDDSDQNHRIVVRPVKGP